MKTFLIYVLIALCCLIAIFIVLVLATIILADNEAERQRYSYNVGYAYGMFLIVVAAASIIYGTFKLLFVRKNSDEDRPGDKDSPIDRYLK